MSKEELENYEMINQSGFKIDDDSKSLQENFFTTYAKSKGWDLTNLTNEQLKEIKSQPGYKNPGMILG